MKKHLLLGVALGIGMYSVAQNQSEKLLKPAVAGKSYPASENKALSGDEIITNKKAPSKTNGSVKPLTSTGTVIGGTTYDLQTNSAISRRIINHGNGTLSVVWTIATDFGPSYATRGTGYQFFNGTSWFSTSSAAVQNRIETAAGPRTGWPSIGVINGRYEFVIGHDATDYLYRQSTNVSVGSETWAAFVNNTIAPRTPASPQMAPAGHGTIWNRMAVAGPGDSTIHMISNVFSSDSTIIRLGVKAPMLYARSMDGGKTFPVSNMPLPKNDSTRTHLQSGDDYDIDAQNNNVAIVHGGLAEDVALWRSMDNGSTWTKTLVDSIPFVKNMTGASATDTMNTNDGSVSVTLDVNNKAHVAYSGSRTLLVAGGVNFFPGTIDLVYWNEINKMKVHIPIALADIDENGDGKYSIGDSTTSITQCRYGSGSVLNKPCITIDSLNNIYIIFSLVQDGDTTQTGDGFRDIWVVASTDGGNTWGHAQNLTDTKQEEEAFASVAKLTTGFLHIAYQHSLTPGTALTNKKADGNNDIMYLKVPTASVLAGTAGVQAGIKSYVQNPSFMVSQNYPNPFSSITNIDVTMSKSSDLTLEVTNLLGQVVYTEFTKSVTGNHTFTVDGSSFGAGVYFYTIRNNETSVTQKMTVK